MRIDRNLAPQKFNFTFFIRFFFQFYKFVLIFPDFFFVSFAANFFLILNPLSSFPFYIIHFQCPFIILNSSSPPTTIRPHGHSRYFISLSGALAVLNIVPCYSLDGQWICKALFNCFLPRWVPNSHSRNIIYSATISIGTFLVASNVFIALWTLFVN